MRCLKFFLLGLAFVVLSNCTASAASLTWNGVTNNNWNTLTSGPKNWLNSGTASYFTSGDIATFDDSGSNAAPINLTDSTNPLTWASGTADGSVIVNAGKNYTFSGIGSLNGGVNTSPFLIKSGTGTLTINTINDYKGTTIINGGKLSITGGGILYNGSSNNPATPIMVNSGGTLEFDNYASGGSFGGLVGNLFIKFAVNGGTLRFADGKSDSTGPYGFLIGNGGATLESASVDPDPEHLGTI